jgi:UDP-N-acetylglucosamine 2-epimerase (non-hydrolysing)
MKRVLSIFGTRPEAIKMAMVVKELGKHPDLFDAKVCVTAQHREMLDQVLRIFSIKPDFDLDLMQDNQTLSGLTARVFTELAPIVSEVDPDWILVQGDTTTVMAASLVAFYQHVKVGHVEAGLRTHDKWRPFPEEINRRIAGVVSDLHFAPTETAKRHLLQEGVNPDCIFVTGNPVIDSLHHVSTMDFDPQDSLLAGIPWEKEIILLTAHRRENFGQPLKNICHAVKEIARMFEEQIHIVYPVHLNPRVSKLAHRKLGGVNNISLLPPLDYLPLVYLMKRSTLVLTDSGGIQEEAPGLGKPVLVLREKTERPEAVEAGTVRLVGTNSKRIISETKRLLEDQEHYQAMATAVNPYGEGTSAQQIVEILRDDG